MTATDKRGNPLLVCGHYANSTTGDGTPACAVHDITMLATFDPPARTGWYCGSCKQTSPEPVAFADVLRGTHYDGCRGWN